MSSSETHTPESTTTDLAPKDILEALRVLKHCTQQWQPAPGLSGEDLEAQYMHTAKTKAVDEGRDPAPAVAREKELLAMGHDYFAQGWRLESTGRQTFGITHTIPINAVSWQIASSGYIAQAAQYRLDYVVNIIDEVMTASEVDAEFELSAGTAKLAANRGTIATRKSAGIWLMLRSDATKKWAKTIGNFAIAIAIAAVLAYL